MTLKEPVLLLRSEDMVTLDNDDTICFLCLSPSQIVLTPVAPMLQLVRSIQWRTFVEIIGGDELLQH